MRRLLVLALLGCASGGSGAAPPDRVVLVDRTNGRVYRTTNDNVSAVEQEVPGTIEGVVQALVGSYEELGVTVNTVQPKDGRVAAESFAAPSRLGGKPVTAYVNCGIDHTGRARAATYAVTLNSSSRVQPASTGQVRVSTVLMATARPRAVSGDPIACESTGELEKRINVLVAARSAK
jgi:hypothetical protein